MLKEVKVTKQGLLEGKPFIVVGHYLKNVYKIEQNTNTDGSISVSICSAWTTKAASQDKFHTHELNVSKMGSKVISAFTFVMGKVIKMTFRYEDLAYAEFTTDGKLNYKI